MFAVSLFAALFAPSTFAMDGSSPDAASVSDQPFLGTSYTWGLDGVMQINFPQDYPLTGTVEGSDGVLSGSLEFLDADITLNLVFSQADAVWSIDLWDSRRAGYGDCVVTRAGQAKADIALTCSGQLNGSGGTSRPFDLFLLGTIAE